MAKLKTEVFLMVSFLVFLTVTTVSAEDIQNGDLRRIVHYRTKRQTGAQQHHEVAASGSRAAHSSSSNQRHFVSPDGRPYYEYRPHVSSSGGGRRVVDEGPVVDGQTYDYPFGRGQINYVSESHSRRASSSSGDGRRSSYSSNSNNRRSGISDISGSGRSSSGGSATYQRRQYHTASHGSGIQGGQSSVSGTAYRQGTGQDARYQGYSANQRRVYRTGTNQNSGHNRSYPNRSNDTQRYNTGYIARRSRYIDPRYGSGASQRTDYTSGQRVRPGSRIYTGRTSSGQVNGYRTRGSTRNQPYSQRYIPYQTQRRGDECPETGVELRIEGLDCHQAVSRYGLAMCYAHELSSRKCCQACRPRRIINKPGCEYGDRVSQCSNIRAVDCYSAENRRICCQTCERLKRSETPGCEYGDRSSRCEAVRLRPGLCYSSENRRMCCQSCAHLKNPAKPDCAWGDHNTQLCRPFESNSTQVRINCYSPRIRNVCCNSCERLKAWVPDDLPAGCEYGDHPVTFLANQVGELTCRTYFNYFSTQHCSLPNSDVARYCCYTCHRYRASNRG